MTAQPPERPAIRIADADRERVAQRLRNALEEGRITVAELEERLTEVYAARFAAELLGPVADLPPEPDAAPPPPATPSGPPLVLQPGRLRRLRRTGGWAVPARLRVRSRIATVLLDFTAAEIAHPVVELEIELGAGTATVVVPDDATVDAEHLVTASLRCDLPGSPRPGARISSCTGNRASPR